MSEEKLIDHVISRLEPQILNYVEIRHPRNTANLLQIVDKYEERFMHRQIRGGRQSGSKNSSFRGQNERSRNLNFLSDDMNRSRINPGKNNDLPPDSPEAYRFAIDYRKLNASGVGIGANSASAKSKTYCFQASRTLNKAEPLRALAINSREQFIKEQREDPELGHIYRYLENPDDGSVNATICESWSQDFKLINGLLFYAKYFSTLGELRVYIPGSLRKDIMKEFHDLPLAGHLGKRKTYLKLRDTCYFPFMRKYIFEYVSTCDRCQKFNYKNALPAGRLMPIVSKYPNEIVTLDLVGPYPASRPERYKFILVITDHFTKWCELIPLRKASAQTIANAFFNNYIARYGAPISLISDNGPQFISDVFEHLSHRLDIKHMKTVTYRPQSNLTERVNRNLVQMIASFVEENHENWDQFLHEFAFALRTAVNETTNKTPAELFLGRKIITPFSKLINVKEDAKYVGNNIERLFDEARRNMQKQHKYWEKHYNLRRRDVHIKVNDLVLLQTHFLSAAGKKQVGKFMPKFEGPYKVLEIKGNNLVIWKNGRNITVNIDQVRVYRPRQSDTISSDSQIETLYDEQEVSHRSNRSHQGQFKEHRKTSSQEMDPEWSCDDNQTVRPELTTRRPTNKRETGRIANSQEDSFPYYSMELQEDNHENLNNIENQSGHLTAYSEEAPAYICKR
ncbi:retrovirus-related Pol polyprotein from transposon 412 [Trichonephila clavipes]|nr:retrovirus-related Pol polyprotein from transposon 412 [Trichonephila clavipes]